MKKLISAIAIFLAVPGAASAADLYTKAPTSVPYDWTGFYAGGNIGYGFANPHVTYSPNDFVAAGFFSPPIAIGSPKLNGVVGGAQVGYNWQASSSWLLGLEADFQGSGQKGSSTSLFGEAQGFNPGGGVTSGQELQWFGTVRGRLGWLANDRLMIFGTGGLAYGEVKSTSTVVLFDRELPLEVISTVNGQSFGFRCTAQNNCLNGSSSAIKTGYTVGGGIEYAPWRNTTFKLEYLYVNLGSTDLSVVANPTQSLGTSTPASFVAHYSGLGFSVVRAGINYRF